MTSCIFGEFPAVARERAKNGQAMDSDDVAVVEKRLEELGGQPPR